MAQLVMLDKNGIVMGGPWKADDEHSPLILTDQDAVGRFDKIKDGKVVENPDKGAMLALAMKKREAKDRIDAVQSEKELYEILK